MFFCSGTVVVTRTAVSLASCRPHRPHTTMVRRPITMDHPHHIITDHPHRPTTMDHRHLTLNHPHHILDRRTTTGLQDHRTTTGLQDHRTITGPQDHRTITGPQILTGSKLMCLNIGRTLFKAQSLDDRCLCNTKSCFFPQVTIILTPSDVSMASATPPATSHKMTSILPVRTGACRSILYQLMSCIECELLGKVSVSQAPESFLVS
uniref:Uncharacterized protein n=1 Tax=Timema genevievae TaxID=629358 RepID=A0A7R9PJU3_TIMGE|nr:unnamed protein product [Timema genevievae]